MMKQFFQTRSAGAFQARSPDRDKATDTAAINSVDMAINAVLEKAKAEQAGLKRRMDDVISRAAIVGGNEIDDHLTRTADRSDMLRKSDAEIRQGQQRLQELDRNIAHFEHVRETLHKRPAA